jgi:hypothetical protein
MTYTDAGVRGATGQSWRGANPRDLLRQVINNHPGSDRTALFRLFVEKLKEEDEDDYMETIIEYWFTNNYHSLLVASAATVADSGETAARREALLATTKEQIRAKIAEAATIVLSDMAMPNGKRLADCTGEECITLARRMGSWLGRIVRRVKPEETVGAVLTEDDLQVLYQKRA